MRGAASSRATSLEDGAGAARTVRLKRETRRGENFILTVGFGDADVLRLETRSSADSIYEGPPLFFIPSHASPWQA